MAETEKSPSEQVTEIEKLIEDSQDKLTQAKWALTTLLKRLEGQEKTNGRRS